MNKKAAIRLAERYASTWEMPWGDVGRVQAVRPWWLLFCVRFYTIRTKWPTGRAFMEVDALLGKVSVCEFHPADGQSWMVPLWAAYPIYNAVTIGWRMGWGETYKYAWHKWWRSQSPEVQRAYRERFPEPDWGAWPGFYTELADVPAKPGDMIDLLIGRV